MRHRLRWLVLVVAGVRDLLLPHHALLLENLALRQQLALYERTRPRPRLSDLDRAFWVALRRLTPAWREVLRVVSPDTVVRWHRRGFARFWTWRSRPRGRPALPRELRALIRTMARANPTWGAPRIRSELAKLGVELSRTTVAKYMPRRPAPRPRGGDAQRWHTFLRNHAVAACDLLVIPTATFRLLYVFVVLSLDRRRVLHVEVATAPSAEWNAQQLREAFPCEHEHDFLLRDRDRLYGHEVDRTSRALGLTTVRTQPRSPWQNGACERFLGTLRRELTDHVVVLGERHLRRLLREYLDYYHRDRTHLALDEDTPDGRDVEPERAGEVVALPRLGGLHHRYTRRAA